MRHNRIICGLTGLGMLLVSSVSANACAGGFMQAFFFHKNPEAKAVATAVASARDRGALLGDRWDKSVGMSLHSWRAEKTKTTIGALQDRLNAVTKVPADIGGAHVFLISEFAWLDILPDGDGIKVTRTSVGPDVGAVRIFTTRRVLDNVLAGNLSLQQAVEQDLIATNCGSECSGNPYGLLRLAVAEMWQ